MTYNTLYTKLIVFGVLDPICPDNFLVTFGRIVLKFGDMIDLYVISYDKSHSIKLTWKSSSVKCLISGKSFRSPPHNHKYSCFYDKTHS